ncbi:hypothetical protein C8T65DRAFT_148761 [Cerioporus squamosus]|nr:hypothetical protein C8T65DRAFT_148761 [Cerioporus squamosus]
MLHNQSILGFSLLVLSCASPSLGDALTPMSPPSSPTLGTNPGRAFQDINPPLVHPASNAPSSSTGVATVIAASSPSLVAGFNPAITPTPLAADVSPASGSLPSASPHRSGKHHAKLHSSIAAHFSSQFQLQAQTLARTPSVSHTSPVPEPTPPAQVQLVQSSTITTSSLASLASSSSADSAVSSSSPDLQVSTSVSSLGSSATLAISGHSFSASTPSMTGFRAVPTSHDLDDPNPDVHTQSSEASQRARRTTVLAALLILGTLGALGGGILCFRCGVFPCCHNKRRRRGPMSAERTVEEGLRGLAKLAPSAFNEKVGSLVPGSPPAQIILSFSPRSHATYMRTPCHAAPVLRTLSTASGAGYLESAWEVRRTFKSTGQTKRASSRTSRIYSPRKPSQTGRCPRKTPRPPPTCAPLATRGPPGRPARRLPAGATLLG